MSLHTHTEHSPLDGLAKVSEVFERASELGQPALAITDHGGLPGIWRAQKAAADAGVKPIMGMEAYLAFGSRDDPGSLEVPSDDAGDDSDEADGTGKTRVRKYMHLTLLAETAEGWTNLVRVRNQSELTKVKVASKSYPLVDFDLIREHREGIIVLTGCLGGPVLGPLSRGDEPGARQGIEACIGAVGAQNVYVEVMEHGLEQESAVLPRLAELASEYRLPLVATNDSHYVHEADHDDHDAWLALRTGKKIADGNRYRFHGDGYHLRSEQEMRALRPEQWWQDAVSNTMLVADRVADRVLPRPQSMLPKFPTPDGYSSNAEYLFKTILGQATATYGTPLPQEVRDRLNHELNVIRNPVPERPDIDFTDYMLMVSEMIRWEHQQGGITGAGRGSGAGSMVAYLTEITALDPLEEGLLFERFLEPGRADFPDIDTDFRRSRREAILRHLADFWGAGRVALIGSVAQDKPKRALKDAARVLGVPPSTADKLSKAVPILAGGQPMPLAQILDETNPQTSDFRRVFAEVERSSRSSDGGVRPERILELARSFENTAAGYGIHACGVLIADRDLSAHLPMRLDEKTGWWVTEWDSRDVEAFGGVKVDVLSLRNLDIAQLAADMIEEQTGEHIDIPSVPRGHEVDNPRVQKAWRLLQEGNTIGVFQAEGAGMSQLFRDVRPDTEADLSAVIALYRPGPLSAGMHTSYALRKNGHEQVDYEYLTSDPSEQSWLATVLGDTYGLMVYQEQLMRLGTVIAGFDVAERSLLRKAVGKKKRDLMEQVGRMLLDRAGTEYRDAAGQVISPVFSRRTAERVFQAMQGAAEYSFNRSHSAAYARLTWQTAFLKANWPAAFGAALLALTTDDKEKRAEALRSLLAEGIDVLPPDVNRSAVATNPEGERSVRLGLSEIKGMSELASARTVAARSYGPFESLHDLMVRVTKHDETSEAAITSSDLAAMIDAGALDSYGPRMGLAAIAKTAKTVDLPVPDIEYGVVERTTRQRGRLLTSLGSSPLQRFQRELREWNAPGPLGPDLMPLRAPATPVSMLPDQDGAVVTTIGVLAAWATRPYRGGTMANLTVEGSSASIRGVLWNEQLERARSSGVIPAVGGLIAVTGRISVREIETEHVDDDGNVEVSTVFLRELTVTTIHPVHVDDPVTGGFNAEVDVPDLTRAAEPEDTLI
ncbi:DNA polymerase III subunit alpha [Microbacterium enclense]|uniref:DNA polymerase III subunit alpha n=1 Tax=Microbacterium enclense TaxID=993073 RepID=UPI003F7DE48C